MQDVSATFRRDIAALPEIFDLVERFFTGNDGAPELRHTVDFVLEEIFTNCVKYNAEGRCGIDIALEQEGPELRVTIVDRDSDRFDPRTDAPAVDTNLPLRQRTPGRLGVHLVQKLMDRVEYDYANRISTITLFKTME